MTDLRRQTILNQSNHSPFQSVPFSPVVTPTRRSWSPVATVPDWSAGDKNQCSFDQNVPQTPVSALTTSGNFGQQRTPLVASTPPDQLVPSTPVERFSTHIVQTPRSSKLRTTRTIAPSPIADFGHQQLNLFDGDDDIFPT